MGKVAKIARTDKGAPDLRRSIPLLFVALYHCVRVLTFVFTVIGAITTYVTMLVRGIVVYNALCPSSAVAMNLNNTLFYSNAILSLVYGLFAFLFDVLMIPFLRDLHNTIRYRFN